MFNLMLKNCSALLQHFTKPSSKLSLPGKSLISLRVVSSSKWVLTTFTFPSPLLLEFDAQRGEFPVKEEQVALHFVNRNELAAIVKDADFDEDTQQNIFSNANTSKSFSSMPSVISLNPARWASHSQQTVFASSKCEKVCCKPPAGGSREWCYWGAAPLYIQFLLSGLL